MRRTSRTCAPGWTRYGSFQTVPCPPCQYPIAAGGLKVLQRARSGSASLYIDGILAGQRASAVNCTQGNRKGRDKI